MTNYTMKDGLQMISLNQFLKIKMANCGLEWQMETYSNSMEKHLKNNSKKNTNAEQRI